MLFRSENTKPTYNEKIMIAKCRDVDKNQYDKIQKLLELDCTSSNIEIVSLIKEIVPEYNPNNTKYDVLNIK